MRMERIALLLGLQLLAVMLASAQNQAPTNAITQPTWVIERAWKGMRECEKRALAAIPDPHWDKPDGLRDEDWKYLLMVRGMMLADNQPVVFYGRAVDQTGKAVSGAKLRLELSRVNEELLATTNTYFALKQGNELQRKPIALTSDADGWFKLKDVTGKYLHLKGVEKEGFLWSSPSFQSFDYEICRDPAPNGKLLDYLDPQTGYTFHLWRKGPTEPLVPINWSIDLRKRNPDGSRKTNFVANLFTGPGSSTDATSWDVSVSWSTEPSAGANGKVRLLYEMAVKDGGLLATDEHFPYAAPSGDYPAVNRFVSDPNAPNSDRWSTNLFIRARSGKVYGGVRLDFEHSGITFTGYLNPSGSRVLEPEDAKLIKDADKIRRLDEDTRRK